MVIDVIIEKSLAIDYYDQTGISSQLGYFFLNLTFLLNGRGNKWP